MVTKKGNKGYTWKEWVAIAGGILGLLAALYHIVTYPLKQQISYLERTRYSEVEKEFEAMEEAHKRKLDNETAAHKAIIEDLSKTIACHTATIHSLSAEIQLQEQKLKDLKRESDYWQNRANLASGYSLLGLPF